jgi:hypothetical protein
VAATVGDINLDGRNTTMTSQSNGKSLSYRSVLVGLAVALGVAFGSYGVASAASGSDSNGTTTTVAPTTAAPAAPPVRARGIRGETSGATRHSSRVTRRRR